VASKALKGEYTGDGQFVERFKREARDAAPLSNLCSYQGCTRPPYSEDTRMDRLQR
jgi:hypothetical protein